MLCFVIFSPSEILLRVITLVHIVLINYCLCVNIYIHIYIFGYTCVGWRQIVIWSNIFFQFHTFYLGHFIANHPHIYRYIYIYIYSHRDSSLWERYAPKLSPLTKFHLGKISQNTALNYYIYSTINEII